ncbi:hypothetical protein [Mycolicibacterium novocastrense]|uniref:Uncharacterized protein n=1 Tax=Mycolicibacterium novocastrense TaxID=59813 RepID=A0ABQ0KDD5_MYCNV|nr:hypothetical protein [Mycolicibacterium novocastrense]GAT07550.1 uncharacterized protein RMCN_0683 [Mycolicibacterium novocastrense]
MPTVQDVQERVAHAAVQLTAASNPLLVWGQAIANTFGSLETLTGDATNANLNLLRELSTGYIFREAANVLILNTLNPGPLLDQVLNFNSNFGPVITSALEGTFEGLRLAAEQFPGVITESLTHLSKGEFFEAFSKVNGWFVLRVLGGGTAADRRLLHPRRLCGSPSRRGEVARAARCDLRVRGHQGDFRTDHRLDRPVDGDL